MLIFLCCGNLKQSDSIFSWMDTHIIVRTDIDDGNTRDCFLYFICNGSVDDVPIRFSPDEVIFESWWRVNYILPCMNIISSQRQLSQYMYECGFSLTS